MDKNQLKKQFEDNVNYLRRNIPPDDIYLFCEQTFMATMFFLKKWSEVVDIEQACNDCPITKKWVCNILGFQRLKDADMSVHVDLNLGSIDEDCD